MAGNSKKSLKDKGSYAIYKNRDQFTKNKVRKLERHLKAFPNDAAAAETLAGIRGVVKSPRWKYAGAVKTKWDENRVVMQIRASLRSLDRVMKFVRDPYALMINNVVYDVYQLKETFGYRQPTKKSDSTNAERKSKPVRRGRKTKSAQAPAVA